MKGLYSPLPRVEDGGHEDDKGRITGISLLAARSEVLRTLLGLRVPVSDEYSVDSKVGSPTSSVAHLPVRAR